VILSAANSPCGKGLLTNVKSVECGPMSRAALCSLWMGLAGEDLAVLVRGPLVRASLVVCFLSATMGMDLWNLLLLLLRFGLRGECLFGAFRSAVPITCAVHFLDASRAVDCAVGSSTPFTVHTAPVTSFILRKRSTDPLAHRLEFVTGLLLESDFGRERRRRSQSQQRYRD
jgi:hypothetical protein